MTGELFWGIASIIAFAVLLIGFTIKNWKELIDELKGKE